MDQNADGNARSERADDAVHGPDAGRRLRRPDARAQPSPFTFNATNILTPSVQPEHVCR